MDYALIGGYFITGSTTSSESNLSDTSCLVSVALTITVTGDSYSVTYFELGWLGLVFRSFHITYLLVARFFIIQDRSLSTWICSSVVRSFRVSASTIRITTG